MSKDFIDNVLIKLKREYQKDEVLMAVIKENSDLLVELGKLKSEIDYLEHQLTLKAKENNQKFIDYKNELQKELNKEVLLDKRIAKQQETIKEKNKIIDNLRKSVSELAYKSLRK
ncbi:MAG TPA: hypothetical protein DCM02_06650 [Flavobacterium sp.]|nr:hypothetical protein [Flavobacterium sp.]HAT81345.1 hypothetical protein [Flavobacterium sp.]